MVTDEDILNWLANIDINKMVLKWNEYCDEQHLPYVRFYPMEEFDTWARTEYPRHLAEWVAHGGGFMAEHPFYTVSGVDYKFVESFDEWQVKSYIRSLLE